ncbi:hypothetical protein [Streptomyces sp. NPDC058326]|uniref:hypothetical protein n=1 Tax=Streptomyces sp. NPDC058326 TaxID=3346447 RepID=UPI0036F0141E
MSAHRLPVLALLGAFAVTAAAAWAAAGRRRGAPAIAGALLAVQGGLHLIFSMAGSHPGDTGHTPPTPAHGGSGGTHTHAHGGTGGTHAVHATHGAGAGADTGMDILSGAASSTAGMLAVHLLAALLCGLWLAHGEAAFFTLARAALAYAFIPLRLLSARVRLPDAPRRPVRRTRRNTHLPHTVVLAHTLSRRGPPHARVPHATALGAHV